MADVMRKLTVILAADVAGYDRLVAADADGTFATLRTLRTELVNAVIATTRGRILKTSGNAMLIEFRTVRDALACAVGVQRGVAKRNEDTGPDTRVEFRVGIHFGDVLIGRGGELSGEAIDVAEALEAVCDPAGIRLSRAAHDAVEGKTAEHFIDCGEVALMDGAAPMRVFAVEMRGSHIPA